MKKFFLEKEDLKGDNFSIKGEDFVHLKKVLRTEVGEEIEILIGDGKSYLCKVSEIFEKEALAKILKVEENLADPKIELTVYQALPKGDKFEFLIQKLNELGVTKLVPFESEFTIKKAKDKEDRYSKISKEACKQCGRSKPLEIMNAVRFKNFIDEIKKEKLVLFAYENELGESKKIEEVLSLLKQNNKIALIIGSEGGFSQSEAREIIEAGGIPISFGRRILRCETACIALTALVSLYLNN